MKTLISEKLMIDAILLSSKWNNTAFIILNESGVPDAMVWNHFQYEDPRPEVIAHVNGNDGFVLKNDNYEFQTNPNDLI